MPSSTLDIDFEIIGTPAEDGDKPPTYLVKRKGGSFAPVDFSWDERLSADLEELRSKEPDQVKLQAIGRRLGKFFADGTMERIRDATKQTPVRITIRLHEVSSEMSALPWELIPLGQSGLTLVSRKNCLLRYQWQGTATAPRATEPPPEGGRILFAYCNVDGQKVPALPHRKVLQKASAAGQLAFNSAEDEVGDQPFAQIVEKLRRAKTDTKSAPFTILHILCHGTPLESNTAAYGLRWRDDSGSPITLAPDAVAEILEEFSGTLRLVVLCVCKAGDSGTPGNPMGSVGRAASSRGHRSSDCLAISAYQ